MLQPYVLLWTAALSAPPERALPLLLRSLWTSPPLSVPSHAHLAGRHGRQLGQDGVAQRLHIVVVLGAGSRRTGRSGEPTRLA